MGNKIIKSGSCLTEWQKEANEEYGKNYQMNYTLKDDGILIISGNAQLGRIPAPDAKPYYDEPIGPPYGWSKYVSQFKDLDFHTVIIEDGVRVLEEECFKDCKNFRKIVLPEKMPVIRKNFAEASPLEYIERDGLLFLGPASNPLYFLMGCKKYFKRKTLIIPEGVVFIADEAFKGKKCIKEVVFPSTLEFAGWYTFEGTSIKEVYIPEGKLAYDETLIAFDGNPGAPLETVSLPYSMYKIYKEGEDTGLIETWNRNCKIIYRNPDDTIAEILEPKSPEDNNISPAENPETDIKKYSDELPLLFD